MGTDYISRLYLAGPAELAESTIQSMGIPKWALSYICPHWGTTRCIDCEEASFLSGCDSECWDCKQNYLCPCWRCDRLCNSCPDLSNCEAIGIRIQRKSNLEWVAILLKDNWFC